MLGELAASVTASFEDHMATNTRTRYEYTLLGIAVCRAVFLDVHGVSAKFLRPLQTLVEIASAEVKPHGGVGR